MSYVSLTDKYNCIKGLVSMAQADGVFNMAELTYVLWVGQKLGLTQVEMKRLLNDKSEHSFPLSTNERIKQFYRLQNLIFIDGHLDENELTQLHEVGIKMRLNESKLNSLMHALPNTKKPLSLEKVIEFLN